MSNEKIESIRRDFRAGRFSNEDLYEFVEYFLEIEHPEIAEPSVNLWTLPKLADTAFTSYADHDTRWMEKIAKGFDETTDK